MDELVRLITSLTKSEKRYFKMFSALQSGEKSYIKLFEAVERTGDYDEKKIRKLLSGEDFLRRLPAVKNYLYGQILKSLCVINSDESASSQVKEMIEEVSILYEKRLYKQCAKILERARSLSAKNELVLLQLEINNWKEKILSETLPLEKYEEFLSETEQENEKLVRVFKNISHYKYLYHHMQVLNKKLKEARTEEELQKFHGIISNSLLQNIDKALCFESKHYFYLIHLIYNHAKGDYEASLSVAEKQLILLESYPDKIKENPKMYISALHNILLCELQLHNYRNFDEILAKLRIFPVKSLNAEVNRFVSSYIFEIVKYLDTGEFTRSAGIRTEILAGLKKYKDRISPIEEATLLYNLFYSYFGTGEFTKALDIINKLINERQKDLRKDIQSAVRILNLILHYELSNTSLLEYRAVSTNRFLYKSKRLYKLESVILDFIRKKVPDIFTPRDEHAAFIKLREQFLELTEHPYEKKAFEYFDYISWADSKIEKKSFEEIVRGKFATKNQHNAG